MLKQFFRSSVSLDAVAVDSQSGLLENRYSQLVESKRIQYDIGQHDLLLRLQLLLEKLVQAGEPGQVKGWKWQQWLAPARESPGSVYIYGGVGSGKTMVMDMFFSACPFPQKRRVHFHAFMQEAHDYMHHWRKNHDGSPLPALATHIRSQYRLLCFDEFHVSDIADAMILGRLFRHMSDLGVVFVATSNRHPDDLYMNGLQRDLFLPFIHWLKEKTDVIRLSAKEDYRLSHIKHLATGYYYPVDDGAEEYLRSSFAEFTNNTEPKLELIQVLGRNIEMTGLHNDMAAVSFAELCRKPLAAADYLELARKFSTFFLSGIPALHPEHRNEAKRLLTLIDVLYEHKVKLICTAEVKPEEIYPKGDGAFEFNRAVSRLYEMQSEDYWSLEHQPE